MFMLFKSKNRFLQKKLEENFDDDEFGNNLDSESGGFEDSSTEETMSVEFIMDCKDNMQPPFDYPRRKSTIVAGIFAIVCTSLDGTALTIPFVIAKCGLIAGPTIIIIFALSTVFTLEVICICARKTGATSYPGVIEKMLGGNFRIFFSVLLLLILFAIIVGFLILMRQIGTNIVIFLTDNRMHPTVVMLCSTAISFPLMLSGSLYRLRYACYISCFSVVCLLINMTGLVVYPIYTHQHYVYAHVRLWPGSYMDIIESVPIISMLFLSHFNILGVFTRLHNPTHERMNHIIYCAQAILAFIFISFGVVGYLVFVAMFDCQYIDNILIIFSPHDKNILFGRVTLFVTVICTIPVMMVPSRELIHEIRQSLEVPGTRLMARIRRSTAVTLHPLGYLSDCMVFGHSQRYYAPGAVQQHHDTSLQYRSYGSYDECMHTSGAGSSSGSGSRDQSKSSVETVGDKHTVARAIEQKTTHKSEMSLIQQITRQTDPQQSIHIPEYGEEGGDGHNAANDGNTHLPSHDSPCERSVSDLSDSARGSEEGSEQGGPTPIKLPTGIM